MRIAVLVKQIPKFDEMELTEDGRLRRDGVELEMNPYCRRAVAKACELAGERPGSSVVVFTLGPPPADDTLREAIAWGLDRDVDITGVHVTDPAFAGSDTLATAKALAAALAHAGAFDLVLTGRNSVDADTGQVGPEIAELLDLPFLTGVRVSDDRRRPRLRTLRAGRRLGGGRGSASCDALVRRTADGPDQGRPARARGRTRPADHAGSVRRISATGPGARTAHRPGSGR